MASHGALVVGVADLLRRPGERRRVRRQVELGGLAITTAAVPEGAEAAVDLDLEAVAGGLVVTGSIEVPWRGECRRCLAEVTGTVTADVREVFERRPVEGETYELAGDHVDLEPMVRDAVLLVLPLAPLCSDGCLGPAPDTFPAHADDGAADDGGSAAGEAPRDPRWAALDDLTFE